MNSEVWTAAMEIREKCDSNFIFTFAVAKVRYNRVATAKIFIKKLFISVSLSTMQQCFINNISKNRY